MNYYYYFRKKGRTALSMYPILETVSSKLPETYERSSFVVNFHLPTKAESIKLYGKYFNLYDCYDVETDLDHNKFLKLSQINIWRF